MSFSLFAFLPKNPKIKKHIIINMFVGLVIGVFLHFFHSSGVLRILEESGIDWMIRMNQGITRDARIGYALLDIDEKTYRNFSEPFFIPRKELLKVVRYATSAAPKMVFVDVEVAKRGDNYYADRAFTRFIREYPEDGVPLILVRSFRQSLAEPSENELRPSFLDTVIKGKKNIFWASTLFHRDSDYSIRRWHLWTHALNMQGNYETVPSVQLLTTALYEQQFRHPDKVFTQLTSQLYEAKFKSKMAGGFMEFSGLKISLLPTPLQQRIIYKFPANARESGVPTYFTGQTEQPLVVQRSVLPLITSNHHVESGWLKDRIVVIGASFSDSRDIHLTPLGEMSGAMILINSIHSLLQHGEIEPPSTWVKVLVEIVLIVVMSFAFAYLHSFWGLVLSGFFVVIVLLPVSFAFFKYGIWLDFVLPLLGILLHEMAAKFEAKIEHKGDH